MHALTCLPYNPVDLERFGPERIDRVQARSMHVTSHPSITQAPSSTPTSASFTAPHGPV
jgi:hypothetical protein